MSEEENLYIAYWEDDRSTGKALLTNIYAQSVSPQSSDCTAYDVSGDGNIDVLDVVIVVNIILDEFDASEDQLNAADINNDGTITVVDIVLLVSLVLNN